MVAQRTSTRHAAVWLSSRYHSIAISVPSLFLFCLLADFKEPLAKLFTPDWEKSNLVTVISATVSDYFTESRLLLDG